jgi:hypothetical protein
MKLTRLEDLKINEAYVYEIRGMPGLGNAFFYMIYLGQRNMINESQQEENVYSFMEILDTPIGFLPVVEQRFYSEASMGHMLNIGSDHNCFMRLATKKEKIKIAKAALCNNQTQVMKHIQ